METMRVWWTIPGSAGAWEWRPETPRLFDARRVVEDDGTEYLHYADEIPGPPVPYLGLPAGQPLVDTTALFAQEANLVPTNLIITWINGRRAVRWDRAADRWTAHDVTGNTVGPPTATLSERTDKYGWSPVLAAGEIAVNLLGLVPVPAEHDDLARQVRHNQDAIR